MKNKRIRFSHTFEKEFAGIPVETRQTTYEKLKLFLGDPSHPSLRVKKVKGTQTVWEMSVTMNYRITFELSEEAVILRRIGTHDVLRHP